VVTSAAKMAMTNLNFISKSHQLAVTLASKKIACPAGQPFGEILVFADSYHYFKGRGK
jgi:hypothetical protein